MDNSRIEINYKDKLGSSILADYLRPFCYDDTVIACIGTDKCIGDCLGPLVGTLLQKSSFPLTVYGTLSSPIHAVNIHEWIKVIKRSHPYSYTIAIDACLSDTDRMGNIEIRQGPIFPGKGIGKSLPSIGDLSVVGIVDSVNNENSLTLHNIRLSFVMEMAEVITESLILAVKKHG